MKQPRNVRSNSRAAHVLVEYLAHYNAHRPHRGLGQRPPELRATRPIANAESPVVRRGVLGGLIHEYEGAA